MIDPLSPPPEVITRLESLKAKCKVIKVNKLHLDQTEPLGIQTGPWSRENERKWKAKYKQRAFKRGPRDA